MQQKPPVTAMFVYGTLQQGEVRSARWPRSPQTVTSATIIARLYDLGPYPAIESGDELVGGELWQFDAADMPATLAALDAIEGYNNSPDDLYVRRIVTAATEDGDEIAAYAYFAASASLLAGAKLVPVGADGVQRWRRNARR